MFGLIQVQQGCIVLDISGMFSKFFAGRIEVARVKHCLRTVRCKKRKINKRFFSSILLPLSPLFKYELMCIWSVAF